MTNNVILIGRLTADPKDKYTQDGTQVCKFTLAVNGRNKTVDFIDVVTWNKLAEVIVKYMQKGRLISVQGRLSSSSYTDSRGIRRRATEVIANSVTFLDSKKETTIQEEDIPNDKTQGDKANDSNRR